MATALIIYASMTGNTEAMALILEEEFKKLGVEAEAVNCLQADIEEFLDYDICVIGAYTYGREGDIPDELYFFYEDMEELDLSGKVYGVMGSGEEFYGYYCRAVDTFDERFKITNATRGADGVKVELYPEEEDTKQLAKFARDLLKTFESLQEENPAAL